jgi:hypothetical protein
MSSMVVPTIIMVVVMVMPIVVVAITPTVGPVGIPSPIGGVVRIAPIGITPVRIPTPSVSPIGIITPVPTPSDIDSRTVVPIERIVTVDIDVVCVSTGVVVVIVAS